MIDLFQKSYFSEKGTKSRGRKRRWRRKLRKPSPLGTILFVDDLSIHIQTTNHETSRRRLLEAVSLVISSLTQHGFKVSPSKSHHMVFQSRKPHKLLSFLSYSGITSPTLDSTKVLGPHSSSNLSRLSHIKHVQAKALRVINILRFLSHPSTGCNRKILLSLYQKVSGVLRLMIRSNDIAWYY